MSAAAAPPDTPATTVSTHILDTAAGRPAAGVAVRLSVRDDNSGAWSVHGESRTDEDGRCKDLPALPEGTAQVRLRYEVEPYLAPGAGPADRHAAEQQDRRPFFPEVTTTFTVNPGEHYHVPLLLNPFGYSVYRGS
ncbi:hydroxyisourate hydrolase [Streptomyces sp. TR06-5]|uniref:hydroxyisourate hydrolase n=1 Tax=unclassified Streptomyces TaxID=2593676 RepID=UPI00399FF3E1